MSITRTYRSGSQVATFAVARQSLRLSRVYGYFNSNSTPNTKVWLQFFSTTVANDGSVSAPTANQVPFESFLMVADYEFAELFNSGLSLVTGPVYCALSTTEPTYTAVANGQTADIYIEVEEWEIEPPTLTTVSLASGNYKQIWADTIAAPSAANALYDLIVADLGNSAGAQLYVQLFFDGGVAAPAAGSIPDRCFLLPIAGTVGMNINCNGCLLLNFGDSERGGLTPLSNTGGQLSSISGTNPLSVTAGPGLGNPCSAVGVGISTTQTTFTAAAANAAKITARYCTPTV